MSKKEKLGLEGVEALWKRVFDCMKTITGAVDTKKGTLQDQINKKIETDGDASETMATFVSAANRTNISTGEKLGVIFGKIAKWLADLKPYSFSDLVQNATTAATDKAVSAAVAKHLQEQINQQNTKITDGNTGIKVKDVYLGDNVYLYHNNGAFGVRVYIDGAHHFFSIQKDGLYFDGSKIT